MNPKVTVLIANHNYGRYIENAIKSCIFQTYPVQICVIDDGSTDNSKEIIENCRPTAPIVEQTYPSFISIYSETAKGPSAARNEGIRQTKDFTDIWQVLDADDEMYPSKVEKMVNALSDPNIGFAYADYDVFNEEAPDILTREYKEPYSKTRLMQECIVHSGFAFKKEALQKCGIDIDHVYNEQLRCAEDWNLELLLSRASIGYHIPESLTKVRIHQNNATNSVNKETWNRCWQYIQEQMKAGIYN